MGHRLESVEAIELSSLLLVSAVLLSASRSILDLHLRGCHFTLVPSALFFFFPSF
uniref:E3 ubiquitin-protein ligase Topors n=1 Tax=Rhizophora mucronata TaxID=61149 RepID=A0A2P2KVM3_RHIMU